MDNSSPRSSQRPFEERRETYDGSRPLLRCLPPRSAMAAWRKQRSFADVSANGSNRPFAALPDRPYEWAGCARKRSLRAVQKSRNPHRCDWGRNSRGFERKGSSENLRRGFVDGLRAMNGREARKAVFRLKV